MKKILTLLTFSLIAFAVFPQQKSNSRMPMLGENAPGFKAKTTMGELNFPSDYYGKWKILFSHPAAFTPVCTTELLELGYLQDEFSKLNTSIVVISTDGLNSHIEWVKSMESLVYKDREPIKLLYPIIADEGYEISRKYGMIHPESNSTKDVRAVFFIDPDNKIRSIFIYPSDVGRNLDEIVRTLEALQTSDKKGILTPANWNLGDDYLVRSPESIKEANKLKSKNDPSMYSLAWYIWFQKGK